jgi:hypothetical protein
LIETQLDLILTRVDIIKKIDQHNSFDIFIKYYSIIITHRHITELLFLDSKMSESAASSSRTHSSEWSHFEIV